MGGKPAKIGFRGHLPARAAARPRPYRIDPRVVNHGHDPVAKIEAFLASEGASEVEVVMRGRQVRPRDNHEIRFSRSGLPRQPWPSALRPRSQALLGRPAHGSKTAGLRLLFPQREGHNALGNCCGHAFLPSLASSPGPS